jgi:hypothetical protein
VAKCSFCRETWFWKYRDRTSKTLLDEIEHQVKNYGLNFIWFIDSLVNGNLKELREFARGVVERKLEIRWMGYARNDGRMDYEYFQDLKASGCMNLSFGVESGSQAVLDLMNKKVKVWEINENLKNCKKVGISSHINWIVGFPNEDTIASAHGMGLIWNNRKFMDVISPGMTFGDSVQSDFEYNRYRYNVSPRTNAFLGWWWGLDWSNTKINRMIRLKMLNIWLVYCKEQGKIENCQHRPSILDHYTITFDDPQFVVAHLLPNEEFNHNIINTELGPLADSVVNEIWVFLRLLWRTRGGFEFNIKFDKQLDTEEFGTILAIDDYSSTTWFKVDQEGNFSAKLHHKFIHAGEYWMQGTKSFEFTWEGTGNWDYNNTQATILSHEQSGTADTCVETVSVDTIAANLVELEKNKRTKKTIAIATQ